jgi:hypothetical protein
MQVSEVGQGPPPAHILTTYRPAGRHALVAQVEAWAGSDDVAGTSQTDVPVYVVPRQPPTMPPSGMGAHPCPTGSPFGAQTPQVVRVSGGRKMDSAEPSGASTEYHQTPSPGSPNEDRAQ